MKKVSQDSATAVANGGPSAGREEKEKTNGNSARVAEPASADLSIILASLQTMRDGDFSVRLPGSWTGLAGKIADTLNDIFNQIQEEMRSQYAIGFTSTNERKDGGFRRLEIRMKDKTLKAQARKGYYAMQPERR